MTVYRYPADRRSERSALRTRKAASDRDLLRARHFGTRREPPSPSPDAHEREPRQGIAGGARCVLERSSEMRGEGRSLLQL